MATSDEAALVDANVLIYASYDEAEHHAAAKALLDQAQAGAIQLYLAPQVLAEFYAVVTDARRVSEAFEPAEALDAIEKFLATPGITLLPVPVDVVPRWIELARQHPVTRGRIFDLQLVATMLGTGVDTIYTFDVADFQKFSDISVRVPQS